MILIEHVTRGHGIEPVGRQRRPRHVHDPVQIGANHLILGRRRGHALETLGFPFGDGGDRFGQLGVGEALAQILGVGLFAFTELALNRLELLAQEILPLRVAHLLFGRRFDLVLHLEQRDLARERGRHTFELGRQLVLLEDLLLFVGLHVEEAREEVGEAKRIVDAGDEPAQLLRESARQRQRAID